MKTHTGKITIRDGCAVLHGEGPEIACHAIHFDGGMGWRVQVLHPSDFASRLPFNGCRLNAPGLDLRDGMLYLRDMLEQDYGLSSPTLVAKVFMARAIVMPDV